MQSLFEPVPNGMKTLHKERGKDEFVNSKNSIVFKGYGAEAEEKKRRKSRRASNENRVEAQIP